MEKSVFAYVRKYGMKPIMLILLIMAPMFGLQILMYQLPKVIIDDAIGGGNSVRQFLGFELERLDYLWVLCAAFLFLVLLIGLIKYVVQVMKGVMAERLLRRLRFQLLERTMRFPLRHFRKTSQNEIVTMVTAEVEPLGGFFGEAYIQPVFQGGIFLVVLIFLFSQNVALGIVASMSMPIQAWVVPRLQRRIRLLGKQRVQTVRALSERIGETVTAMGDLHTNDGIRYAQSDFSGRLGKIFDIRFEIYRRKFFMKFLNNFINQLTPFFFYSIGGYLVITGSLSLGALTAGLVAYKDLAAPWKELLNWYQLQADSTIKYDALIEQFQPAGMFEAGTQQGLPQQIPDWRGSTLRVSGLTLAEGDDWKPVDRVSNTFRPGEPVLITGTSSSGKHELAGVLSGLVQPSSGKIVIGDTDFLSLHRSVVGCRIGYAGAESALFSGSMRENLLLGLKRMPQAGTEDKARAYFEKEARASGNSDLPLDVDWVSLDAAGLVDRPALRKRFLTVVKMLEMGSELYQAGLQTVIAADDHPDLVNGLLEARRKLAQRLQTEDQQDLVQRFQENAFNRYASVAENVVYGQPTDQTFAFGQLGENEYVQELLAAEGLAQDFLDMGVHLAQLMVDLFQDAESGDYFFEQFSFVDADGLSQLASLVRRYETGGETALTPEDMNKLRSLPFHLVPQRHRLNLVDADMEARLVRLRHAFRRGLPEDLVGKVMFLEEDAYNSGLSVQANILFGRVAHGRAHAGQRLNRILADILDEMDLRESVILAALDQDVGKGGNRLPLAQRQLLILARTLVKDPHILIVNEALSALPSNERMRIAQQLIAHYNDRVLIWIDNNLMDGVPFSQRFEMREGKLVDLEVDATAPKDEDSRVLATAETRQESGLASEVEQLWRVPLFSGMGRQALRLLAFSSEVVAFKAGEHVFHQGDSGDNAYVILKGSGEIWLEDEKTDVQKINEVGVNALVGEMALLGDADTRRSAGFVAVEDMECLKISREVFVELVLQDSTIAAQITRTLTQRLQDTLRLVH